MLDGFERFVEGRRVMLYVVDLESNVDGVGWCRFRYFDYAT